MFEVEEREAQFVADADLAVAVLGAGEQYLYIDLSEGLSNRAAFDASVSEAKARGFIHCGFLRAKAGVPEALCADPRGILTMTYAACTWIRSIADYFRPAPVQTGDSVEWLSRLYAVPDTRTDYGPN